MKTTCNVEQILGKWAHESESTFIKIWLAS